MLTFADKAILFFKGLKFMGELPEGISIMNPFTENPEVITVVESFFRKYYSDYRKRRLILGINPGRFGGGLTGIPFTDTIRLKEKCGFSIPGVRSYEPSSVFMYEMIEKYGGTERFYGDYYVSSVSPLGFTTSVTSGRVVNFNYYDNPELAEAITEFAVDSINKQIDFGILTDICYCLGTGKNFKFLSKLNDRHQFFGRIIPLEHPRFIMQYRSKQKAFFLNSYISSFRSSDVINSGVDS